jgi:hypothetical protein
VEEDVVYLEGSCGHEFEWNITNGVAPSSGICSVHGTTSLWAQRLFPSSANLPRGVLTGEEGVRFTTNFGRKVEKK